MGKKSFGHSNQQINRTTYPINALRHKIRLAFFAPAGQSTNRCPTASNLAASKPPAQLQREIPTHASQREDLSQQLDELAQSQSRIFEPTDVKSTSQPW